MLSSSSSLTEMETVEINTRISNQDIGASNTTTISKYCSWYTQFRNVSNPWMARYAYALIFLMANMLAWAARDELPTLGALLEMKEFRGCKVGKNCLGKEGVLRVSMGCFVFYMIMFWSTAGTSKLNDARDKWHSGWWSLKIVLWVVTTLFPFLLPSQIIQIYGHVSHFGAGIFLLVQLISIISFITWLNDRWTSEKYAERCQIHVMIFALIAYCICLVGIILMYIWYAPQPYCLLNLFFITGTLILLQIMTTVSLHSKVNAGILSPGLMGLYTVYLCWSAMRSEPEEYICILNSDFPTRTDWQSIISFVVAILAIVIATFSTGIDSKCFQFRKDDTPAEDDVPYGYGFFHAVFATGAMYFAMLLNGWNSHHSMRKWTIDVGWASTWVRIINEWLAVCLYVWMLLAPIIWKSRYADST
ncbi:PREDICTED: probable serine incorporator [Lupinus angustifolius]|uniref:probable serine incorporator n=1 Tax=Lupinus angustifolius TaxID=3871 RepID=UPI00092E88BF|nr:PREDICTED: probable serine incorporator [Lupinus angustifolius]